MAEKYKVLANQYEQDNKNNPNANIWEDLFFNLPTDWDLSREHYPDSATVIFNDGSVLSWNPMHGEWVVSF